MKLLPAYAESLQDYFIPLPEMSPEVVEFGRMYDALFKALCLSTTRPKTLAELMREQYYQDVLDRANRQLLERQLERPT